MIVCTAWDCGTPKSTHTAFTIPPKREPAELVKRARVTPHPTRSHMAVTAMESPEERSARIKAANQARKTEMLRFKGDVHNFAPAKTPSKLIHRATGAMRTI